MHVVGARARLVTSKAVCGVRLCKEHSAVAAAMIKTNTARCETATISTHERRYCNHYSNAAAAAAAAATTTAMKRSHRSRVRAHTLDGRGLRACARR